MHCICRRVEYLVEKIYVKSYLFRRNVSIITSRVLNLLFIGLSCDKNPILHRVKRNFNQHKLVLLSNIKSFFFFQFQFNIPLHHTTYYSNYVLQKK